MPIPRHEVPARAADTLEADTREHGRFDLAGARRTRRRSMARESGDGRVVRRESVTLA